MKLIKWKTEKNRENQWNQKIFIKIYKMHKYYIDQDKTEDNTN